MKAGIGRTVGDFVREMKKYAGLVHCFYFSKMKHNLPVSLKAPQECPRLTLFDYLGVSVKFIELSIFSRPDVNFDFRLEPSLTVFSTKLATIFKTLGKEKIATRGKT